MVTESERARVRSGRCHGTAALIATLIACAAHAQALTPPSTTVPAVVRSHAASYVAAPDPEAPIHIGVSLPMRNMQELVTLVAAQQDPSSTQYRRYLSVEEFTRRFGPSEEDYAAVAQYFASLNLQVSASASNRYLIDVDGRLADIERAVGVRFGLYAAPNETRLFLAPDREPRLALAVPINHISGLDNYVLPQTRRLRQDDAVKIGHGPTGSAPDHNFSGFDIRTAYYGVEGLTGAGQSIGLFEFGGWDPADIALYFSSLGTTTSVPVVGVSVDGVAVNCTGCEDGEQALDIEYAMSVAPGASQVQVYVGGTEYDIFERMATDNTSNVLSVSWGLDPGEKDAEDPLFLEMAAQGQTLLTASGDYSSLPASGPWPEESAYITGVGGTDLTTFGAGGPWRSEVGWQDSAGGPSVDPSIFIPRYQIPFVTAVNHASPTLRNVPDVSADASFGLYDCDTGQCSGWWGGTSYASPVWAGLVALANERAAILGKPPVGFLNPTLYRLARSNKYQQLFHDPFRGRSGDYSAVPGYDLVTGLGTPTRALIEELAN